jgi:hypothetical protein
MHKIESPGELLPALPPAPQSEVIVLDAEALAHVVGGMAMGGPGGGWCALVDRGPGAGW